MASSLCPRYPGNDLSNHAVAIVLAMGDMTHSTALCLTHHHRF